MSAQYEDRDISQTDWFDPFPEPHTIPSGWDLSGLFPDLQPAAAIDKDDFAASSQTSEVFHNEIKS